MMKSLKVTAAVLFSGLFMASTASAGVIVDVVTQLTKVNNSSVSYTHDINDDGFVLGSALGGSLSIDIFDDNKDGFLGYEGEFATIVVESFDFDTGGTWGQLLFSAAPGWVNDLGLVALGAINSNGFLDIEISGLGDFWVGNSTLTIATADVAVPEPGTLSMLALGLLSIAAISRRRRMS